MFCLILYTNWYTCILFLIWWNWYIWIITFLIEEILKDIIASIEYNIFKNKNSSNTQAHFMIFFWCCDTFWITKLFKTLHTFLLKCDFSMYLRCVSFCNFNTSLKLKPLWSICFFWGWILQLTDVQQPGGEMLHWLCWYVPSQNFGQTRGDLCASLCWEVLEAFNACWAEICWAQPRRSYPRLRYIL